MSSSSNSVVSRLVDRVFPIMPDFYGLMSEQCDLAVEAMDALVEFMETGKQDKVHKKKAVFSCLEPVDYNRIYSLSVKKIDTKT